MQTFLPYPDFYDSHMCLDKSRLGNQVYREGLTLLNGGWGNHPASKMWKDYKPALALYCLAGALAMKDRGWYSEEVTDRWITRFSRMYDAWGGDELFEYPPWLGNMQLHLSHRSNLIRKDPEWYGQFGWKVGPGWDYWWPIS